MQIRVWQHDLLHKILRLDIVDLSWSFTIWYILKKNERTDQLKNFTTSNQVMSTLKLMEVPLLRFTIKTCLHEWKYRVYKKVQNTGYAWEHENETKMNLYQNHGNRTGEKRFLIRHTTSSVKVWWRWHYSMDTWSVICTELTLCSDSPKCCKTQKKALHRAHGSSNRNSRVNKKNVSLSKGHIFYGPNSTTVVSLVTYSICTSKNCSTNIPHWCLIEAFSLS